MSELLLTKSSQSGPIDLTRPPVQCEGSPDVFIYPRVDTNEIARTCDGLPIGHIAFVAAETLPEPLSEDT